MKEKKINFTIEEMELALDEIINQISQTEWFPDLIISINRGGCVPGVYLSHAINVPHKVIDVQLRDEKNKPNLAKLENSLISYSKILIIDDINNTGATFKLIDHAIDKKEIKIYSDDTLTDIYLRVQSLEQQMMIDSIKILNDKNDLTMKSITFLESPSS